MAYEVVPNHIYGPSIIRRGTLVDTCPSLESAHRMADALNELEIAPLEWSLPYMQACTEQEKERIIRHLAKWIKSAY